MATPNPQAPTPEVPSVWQLLRPGMLPFMWALLFAAFSVGYRVLDLPDPQETTAFFRSAFERYGLLIVVPAAFIEGLFMVSIYFPGSLVVVLAVLFAGESISEVLLVSVLAWIGFVMALPANYFLGREGFYRLLLRLGRRDVVTDMQLWLERRGRIALFLTAFHPNLLAVALVCLGIARRGLAWSVAIASMCMLPWLALVVVLIRLLRDRVNPSDSNQAWYFTGALIVWGLVLVVKEGLARRRQMG